MAKETPLYQGETIDFEGEHAGRSWVIEPTHAGHTLTVLGPIVRKGEALTIYMAECSCGDRFRMHKGTIEKALTRRAVAL